MRLSAGAADEQIAEWNAKLNRPWYAPILRMGETSAFVNMLFEPTPAEDFEFNPETGRIRAYLGTGVDVVVPREVDGVTVVGFEGYNVFASCQDFTNTETAADQTDSVHLRTLVLPETIQEIPDVLLTYCQQLENFICYAPVESIGKSTFALCRSLKNAAFLNGVRVIDSYAFDSTDSLENLYFGAHVQKIASNAFNFSGLTSFIVDADEIETGAFTACENLTSQHFTEKVRTIGETFAMECPNLRELCFDCSLTNSLLLLSAAPQLTVRITADADENTRSLAQSCMSWSEAPSEITVTSEKCAHTLPARPDAAALLPELALTEAAEPAPEAAVLPEALNEVLSEKWANLRGVEIVSCGVNSVKASDEDEAMIKELQKNAVFRNANMAAAHLVGAQAQAMQDATRNQGGAFTGFMGMNMAQQGGGINATQLFQMGAQQQAQAPRQGAPVQSGASAWKCACGATAAGRFCPECGDPFDENDRA